MAEDKNISISSGSKADSKAISEANVIISEGKSCPFGHKSAKLEVKCEFDTTSQKYKYFKRCTLATSINSFFIFFTFVFHKTSRKSWHYKILLAYMMS